MIRNGEGGLDAAAGRLSRALETLEQRIGNLSREPAGPSEGDESLRADLRSARERERALESAAAEASATLGRAADQIRAALQEEDEEVLLAEPQYAPEPQRPDLDSMSDDETDLHQPRFGFRNGDA